MGINVLNCVATGVAESYKKLVTFPGVTGNAERINGCNQETKNPEESKSYMLAIEREYIKI